MKNQNFTFNKFISDKWDVQATDTINGHAACGMFYLDGLSFAKSGR